MDKKTSILLENSIKMKSFPIYYVLLALLFTTCDLSSDTINEKSSSSSAMDSFEVIDLSVATRSSVQKHSKQLKINKQDQIFLIEDEHIWSTSNDRREFSADKIEKYKSFIIANPLSMRILDALMGIALQYEAFSGTVDDMLYFKNEALILLTDIRQRLLDPFRINLVDQKVRQIKKDRQKLRFKLQILPVQDTFYLHDSLKFKTEVINRTSITQYIQLYSGQLPFIAFFHEERARFKADSIQLKTSLVKYRIPPKDTLRFELNISAKVRHWGENKTGRISYAEAGRNHISIHDPAKQIRSYVLNFLIVEKK